MGTKRNAGRTLVNIALLVLVAGAIGVATLRRTPEPPPVNAAAIQGRSFMDVPATPEPATAPAPDATPEPAPVEVAAAPAAATEASGGGAAGFLKTSFRELSAFDYELPEIPETGVVAPEALSLDRFPQPVRQLDQQRVSLEGFMIPIEVDKSLVRSFVLVPSPMFCCFGQVPKMNEWVYVEVEPGQKAKIMVDMPVTVYGNFRVGEEIEQGTVTSLFRIKAQRVEGPRTL
ncbi:MAG: DUF3299 domain-containing protein [Candidatus Sumerlaeia bacterium]|nr:DUF3299 domain-containing protein [Candidatus Sumerlaeia bacterium]